MTEPVSHQKAKRQRPDPGPRCNPADVEIWEQLQRALTKLDQAEQREKELRRERDRALFDLKTEGERHEETQERAEQAEAQRDTLAEALREIAFGVKLPCDHKYDAASNNLWCRHCCQHDDDGPCPYDKTPQARALDALDQTNREGIQ